MDLNVPDTRQQILERRLADGVHIVAAEIAVEFDVSIDTARRDLISLERSGKAHRVRGGAIPVMPPAAPMQEKIAHGKRPPAAMIAAAVDSLADCKTVILDGGSTVWALAKALKPRAGLLIVTPSPWVAIACMENGIEVVLLGGRLSGHGGVSVGLDCEEQLGQLAAETAVLGACAMDADFGLSSDNMDESRVKKMMANAAVKTVALADRTKLGSRARHRTLLPTALDGLITDGTPSECAAFQAKGIMVKNV
ncbi:DeoR/GlpR family DNA-binding transcription regulator [uncultured Roseobacter sp.]|uniref:DeoR/GlpR family DNA-binding transcription regulator n=1 Tax=uncultured Roseobacter sp. TaxID=114847 RepID=UPI0026222166|nr:DeoR/GlpR family DNA-binding transcription regulator [uncultured Roseobacter sp.]